jgi:hypothetical protein
MDVSAGRVNQLFVERRSSFSHIVSFKVRNLGILAPRSKPTGTLVLGYHDDGQDAGTDKIPNPRARSPRSDQQHNESENAKTSTVINAHRIRYYIWGQNQKLEPDPNARASTIINTFHYKCCMQSWKMAQPTVLYEITNAPTDNGRSLPCAVMDANASRARF